MFERKQVIRPEELEEVDTEESTILENRDYAESIKASRDNIKIQKRSTTYDVQFVLLGMEHQEKIHYAMPMRVMGYDYASYKKQYDSNAKNYKTKEGLTEDEYLSRMKKTDKIVLDKSISKNEAKKRAIEYSEEHKTDKSVIMTVAGATNTKLDLNLVFRKMTFWKDCRRN